jgi:hypothetical protein
MSKQTPEESKAVALYVILDRDWSDFLEMIQEEVPAVLTILLSLLELPNNKHNPRTKRLNAMGASCVRRVLEEWYEPE